MAALQGAPSPDPGPPHTPSWTGGPCVGREGTAPAPSTARGPPTLAVQADVHDTVLDLHVPAQVSLEVELAGAVGALEGLAARVQMHVAQQVVHAIEGLPTHLEHSGRHPQPAGSPPCPGPSPLLPPRGGLRSLTTDNARFVLSYVTREAREASTQPPCWAPAPCVCLLRAPELELSEAQGSPPVAAP